MLTFAKTTNNNQPTRESMSRFNLRGRTANWERLNVVALNTKNGKMETVSEIPEGLKLTVHILPEEESANAYNMAKRRAYALLRDNAVIGWATFHRRRHTYNVHVGIVTDTIVRVRATSPEEATIKAAALAEKNGNAVAYATTD